MDRGSLALAEGPRLKEEQLILPLEAFLESLMSSFDTFHHINLTEYMRV